MSDTSTLELEAGHHQRILDLLTRELGDGVLDSVLERNDLWVRVKNESWHEAVRVCRDIAGLRFLSFIAGIDWLNNPALSGEKSFTGEAGDDEDDEVEDDAPAEDEAVAAVETGLAGGDTRFQVLARLFDTTRHVGVNLKADLDDADPRIATVTDLFRGADWHEREAWEMYGFHFDGHAGLRHLYLPGGFEGHPLRKDFPLLAREVKPWPGLVNVEPIPDHLDPKKIAEREAAAAEAAAALEAPAETTAETPSEETPA